LLDDWPELCALLHLRAVPHFTTLQKASHRLLTGPRVRRLLGQTVRRCYGRRRRVRRVAFDSTGLEYGRRSAYYVRRRHGTAKRWQTVAYSRFAKLEAVLDCDSHLLVAVLVGRGPQPDVARFVPLLEATLAAVRPDAALADAGYDSEPNHRHARERRGVRSFIPAKHGRPSPRPPTGRYRRQMRQRLNKHYGGYGQRWQVEKTQADYPSSRRWVGTRRIGYHRRDGAARAVGVVPPAPRRPHRRSRMSDPTRRRPTPPRA
jgi:hypothetical protein